MPRTAYEYALELLTARAYTARNLRRKLVQKSFGAEEIAAAEERLTGAGLLDDRRFAAEYARQKLTSGGKSVRRVRQELAQRGISCDVAESAVAAVMEDEPVDLRRSIEAAAAKKLASLGGLERDVQRRRLYAFLYRRGFEPSEISRVVNVLFSVAAGD